MQAIFDTSLETGNELIDGQHKELIGKINDLLKSCETGREKTTAIKMLDYLSDYTDFHFSAEENLQKEMNYPALAEHQVQHKAFIQAIQELYIMLTEEEGPSDAFVEAVNKNVTEWLYTHIKGFDKAVAEYAHSK